ncbi:MAG TPA: hypothetical protein VHB50_02465, partial [Bryobacteraceae bacterium]|nr:hypothetical protein [Bryobacteraceae bacterium]
ENEIDKLIAATGFDPRKDVTEILAASNGVQPKPDTLVMAKGNFDVGKIVAAVSTKSNQQVQTYGGATLITGTDSKIEHAVAFLGSNIAVAGPLASVKAAIDRSTGVNSINPSLAAQVQTLSTTEDAWSVSVASLASLLPGTITGPKDNPVAAQTLQLVKNIQSSSGGVKFGANVLVTGQAIADTPEDATALADVVRMVASLVSIAGQNGKAGDAAALLQNLQVTTSGSTVNISASIPESQIETLLNDSGASKHEAAMKARRM